MIGKLKSLIPVKPSFENVIFWGILFFCFLAAVASAIFTATENFGTVAVVYSFGIALFFLVLAFFARGAKNYNGFYIVLSIAINTFILPPMFFICGGFNSGMPFYLLTSILVLSLIHSVKARWIVLVYSLILYEIVFGFVWFHPEYVPPIAPDAVILDVMVSFLFMAMLIFMIISYLLKAYHKERNDKDQLISQLNFYSSHDPLTGLLNRRYLIDYICGTLWQRRKGFYLMMYDVDKFKKLNDSKGHVFGDQVLSKIAEIAKKFRKSEVGEIAVRYGGEEFIQVIRADSMDEALKRANDFRVAVSELVFEEAPEIRVTFSGGLVDCSNPEFETYSKLLHCVDRLLYLAKERGRNRIIERE